MSIHSSHATRLGLMQPVFECLGKQLCANCLGRDHLLDAISNCKTLAKHPCMEWALMVMLTRHAQLANLNSDSESNLGQRPWLSCWLPGLATAKKHIVMPRQQSELIYREINGRAGNMALLKSLIQATMKTMQHASLYFPSEPFLSLGGQSAESETCDVYGCM